MNHNYILIKNYGIIVKGESYSLEKVDIWAIGIIIDEIIHNGKPFYDSNRNNVDDIRCYNKSIAVLFTLL